MAKKIFSLSNLWFFTLAALVVILAISHASDLEQIISLLKTLDPIWIFLALLAQSATYIFAGNIFYTLLEIFNKQYLFTRWELFKTAVVVLFINQAVPSGGISGITFLLSRFSKKNLPLSESIRTVVIELMTFYSTMVLALIASFIIVFAHQSIPHSVNIVVSFGLIFYIFLGVFVSALGSRRFITKISTWRKYKIVNWLLTKFSPLPQFEMLEEIRHPWHVIRTHKKIFLKGLLSQWEVLLLDVVTLTLLFNGLHTPLSIDRILAGFILTNVVAALPISPGALVTFEASMTFFYNLFGVPVHNALLVALFFRIFSFWLPIPAGLIIYRGLEKNSQTPPLNS